MGVKIFLATCTILLLQVVSSAAGLVERQSGRWVDELSSGIPSRGVVAEMGHKATTTIGKLAKKTTRATHVAPVIKNAVRPPATTSLAVQTPAAQSPPDVITEIEEQIFTLQNSERVKNGLPPLSHDAALSAVARFHSADMAQQNYFDHTDRNGCSSACRVNNIGYRWWAVGENIFETEGYDLGAEATARLMVEGWMNSPGHRANILNASFTNAGVGVAQVGDRIYATVDFSRPR